MRTWVWTTILLTACGETFLSGTDKGPTDPDDTDPQTDPAVPDILVEPALVQFGTLPPSCPSADQQVTVSNVGTAPLVIDSVTIEGADRAAFTHTNPSLNLGPNESTEVFVDFTARDVVPYTAARLVIASNDPDEEIVRVDLQGEGGDEGVFEEVFVQDPSSGVDVLFVLDTSGSMSGDIDDLKVHFATFINVFLTLGLDYHLAVLPIDEDCPTFVGPVIDASNPDPAAEFIAQLNKDVCDSNETAFNVVTKALSPANLAGPNKGFLRPDADLAVVVFTDEPEQSGSFLSRPSPASFVNFLVSLKGGDASKVTFSGLVGPENVNEAANCLFRLNPALPDNRHHEAIRRSGGYLGRICNVKVQPFLRLLSGTASGLNLTFTLSRQPNTADTSQFEVLVDGAKVAEAAQDGWVYVGADNAIVFEGNAVPKPGATITVRYPTDLVCE